MAALGALAAALAVLFMPVGLIETVVASSGISEAVPAAAPPLGQTARLLLAGFAGLMAAGITGLTARTQDGGREDSEEQVREPRARGAKTMGFAFSKLTALARGRAAPVEDAPVPALRRADAHPDAPARAPIFASKDFDGLDIFDRAPPADEAAAPAEPTFLRAAPPALEPDVEEAEPLWDEPLSFAAPADRRPADRLEEPLAPLPLRAPTQGLSITELTERLERGLSQRTRATVPPVACSGVIADMPVAQPVPVRDHVARDTDAALREALGTLRSMAGRR
ncbi:hypothetical protein SAMIE_1025520 [Sphingobium amiense]|uniref:Uncharacterized protein n=2 Tax=Sphingobium amiense TaxID=135719 RepID=A0A494W4A9_9SPHN|nr:hypothetical protein SAMIE_1025520 [Sphingobium amiense]